MTDLYKQSGVNLDEADNLNKMLRTNVFTKNSGAFVGEVNFKNSKILNCCDGIGSKIIPLYERKLYRTIAVDLVAANLNDMATKNARAVAFSDYVAVNKLDSIAIASIIYELKKELSRYNCELVGGETSEIPHLLKEGTIDICGFAIGISENFEINEINDVQSGDIIIGLASSGIHANGFTLIRKLFSEGKLTENEFEKCLTPSFVYYEVIQKLWENNLIKVGANITGGGIWDNLSRVIPSELDVKLDFQNIPSQKIYQKLKTLVGEEIMNVFNCGVGFCVISSAQNVSKIFKKCEFFKPFILGEVVKK